MAEIPVHDLRGRGSKGGGDSRPAAPEDAIMREAQQQQAIPPSSAEAQMRRSAESRQRQPQQQQKDEQQQPQQPQQQEQGQAAQRRRDPRRALVEEYMRRDPICLEKDAPLRHAAEVLLRHNISGAPVVEPYQGDTTGCGRLLGVFSEEDLLWKEVEATDKGLSDTFREPYLWSLMVSDRYMMRTVEEQAMKVLSNSVGLSMSETPISVAPTTPMREAASIMLDAQVKRLPVVSPRDGSRPGLTVVGIITRRDVLRHVMAVLASQEEEDAAARRGGSGIEEQMGEAESEKEGEAHVVEGDRTDVAAGGAPARAVGKGGGIEAGQAEVREELLGAGAETAERKGRGDAAAA